MERETIIPLTMARLKFGIGATEELGYELRTLGVRKVLLVTDGRLWEPGLVDKAKAVLEGEKIALVIYDEVQCEPTDVSMRQAIEKTKGVDFDAIVALGGGSTIDTAKAVNLCHTYPADLMDYINAPIGKGKPVPGPLKPLVALPTTSGSGSETTTVIVLDLLEMHLKTGISHQHIRPTVALVDPLNTLSAPPAVTAATGLDVLTHAAESFTIKPYDMRPKPKDPSARPPYIGANPIADLWSEKAIEWGGKYLRRACYNGADVEAKSHMAMAATFAGIGFGNAGVHIPHALGYPIAGMVKGWIPPGYATEKPMVPHGLSVSLTAAANFRFTAPSNPEKHARIAALLGVNTEGLPAMEAALKLPEAFTRLMRDIGSPNGLRAVGYSEADIPGLVEGGMKQQRLLVGSPRPVTREELTRIVEESMTLW
ncbi:MAG TPA: hydroxyacid-oxoacid transhydrogenase [Candidatus Deferrimicrobiaceae bacterium]|nr:hydroxyacid-oxoacid transhydrogenase [Candidatus Deferrimicrobiaceae bacterium]